MKHTKMGPCLLLSLGNNDFVSYEYCLIEIFSA